MEIPFFADRKDDELSIAMVAPRLRLVQFLPMEIIYHRGDHPVNCYFLCKGTVGYLSGGEWGHFPYQLLPHGSYFGESEIMVPAKRQYTVRAETKSECLVISKKDLFTVFLEFPEIAAELRETALAREEKARKRSMLTRRAPRSPSRKRTMERRSQSCLDIGYESSSLFLESPPGPLSAVSPVAKRQEEPRTVPVKLRQKSATEDLTSSASSSAVATADTDGDPVLSKSAVETGKEMEGPGQRSTIRTVSFTPGDTQAPSRPAGRQKQEAPLHSSPPPMLTGTSAHPPTPCNEQDGDTTPLWVQELVTSAVIEQTDADAPVPCADRQETQFLCGGSSHAHLVEVPTRAPTVEDVPVLHSEPVTGRAGSMAGAQMAGMFKWEGARTTNPLFRSFHQSADESRRGSASDLQLGALHPPVLPQSVSERLVKYDNNAGASSDLASPSRAGVPTSTAILAGCTASLKIIQEECDRVRKALDDKAATHTGGGDALGMADVLARLTNIEAQIRVASSWQKAFTESQIEVINFLKGLDFNLQMILAVVNRD